MLQLCSTLTRISNKTCSSYIYKAARGLSQEVDLKFNDISLTKYVHHLQAEHKKLKEQPVSRTTSQRLLELQPIMDALQRRQSLVDDIINLKELLTEKDDEMRKLAESEKSNYNEDISKVDEELIQLLMPSDVDDCRNAIHFEVKAGVGGQEAMLFAGELFQMYCSFGQFKGWDVEVADCELTEGGGMRHGSALIEGENVFR